MGRSTRSSGRRIDDGKGLNDPFPVDTRLSPDDRFRKANELLWSAHNDLSRAEDVPESRGLRNRAIGHVDQAHGIVDRVEKTAQWQSVARTAGLRPCRPRDVPGCYGRGAW